jgi:mercuric reductase
MSAAITATEAGARVAMVERGTIGGTCVNIGCVPSKTLLRGSEIYHQAAHHPFRGIETTAAGVDMSRFVDQKDELVSQMRNDKYADLIEDYGWELIRGEARFLDEQTIEVGGRRIKAGAYVIATGADPEVPSIPGLQEAGYLTSTSALALTEIPSSLFVIGAGYIALELGQFFNRLGSKVTIMQRGEQLLGEYEPEIGELLRQVLTEQGIKVITRANVERVEGTQGSKGKKVHLTIDAKTELCEADQILVATGRTPNTAELNLGAAGVEVDERGAIRIDERLRTTNPRVWSAGDVTLGPQFVYAASYEGKLAAENALNNADHAVDFTALPAVIFTYPQVAVVGLTERQAREGGYTVKSRVLPLDVVPRARVNHDTVGLVKLVAEEMSNRILGVHIVSENAGDVIYAGTLAVKHGLTIEDLVDSFAPYLTMAESLKLAAQSFDRDVHKLSCCAA